MPNILEKMGLLYTTVHFQRPLDGRIENRNLKQIALYLTPDVHTGKVVIICLMVLSNQF